MWTTPEIPIVWVGALLALVLAAFGMPEPRPMVSDAPAPATAWSGTAQADTGPRRSKAPP